MTLFHGARFFTMEREGDSVRAVLTDGGRILELFRTDPPDIPTARRIDLGGSFAYPGFIDTHTHSFEGGLYTISADLDGAESLDEVFRRLSAAQPIGGKLFGWRFDENRLAERRFPTVEELDRVVPDIPLMIRRVDGHSCILNSAALRAVAWSADARPRAAQLVRQENSEASRWFHGTLGREAVLEAYRAASREALAGGHTTVHTMISEGRGCPDHFELIRDRASEFPVEFVLYPQQDSVERALELGSPRIGGCILVDGSFGSRTAALLEPYADRPESSGTLYRADEYWRDLVRRAHAAGLQMAVHAIGDAAVSQIFRIYREVEEQSPKGLRHQIIHCELVPDEVMDGMAGAGVSAVMQPLFDRLWGGRDGFYAQVLGPDRALRCNRLRSLRERGVAVTGGSDWYITPVDAIRGIDAATRMHDPDEALSPWQAVELYTRLAAELSGDGGRLGRIAPGLQADFTVLDRDLFGGGPVGDARVLRVIKRGRVVWPEMRDIGAGGSGPTDITTAGLSSGVDPVEPASAPDS